MTTKRKSTGTRLRFEIFKRDGFRCVYCGATPLQSPLHADHVIPVAEGGETTAANLVTSCQPCNGGKSAVPLERRALSTPDRESLQAQADHLEQLREYMALQKEIDAAKQAAVNVVADHWEAVIGPMSQGMADRLPGLLKDWGYERLVEAIRITGAKMGRPNKPYWSVAAESQAKYLHGILRRWRMEAGPG